MPTPWDADYKVKGANVTDEKPRGRLARGAGFLTSGEDFIGATTGFDIKRLPGWLEEPLDILANPLSIGLIAASPFTGGASLAALGPRVVGQRLAGTAIKGLAGGLVGGQIAKEVSKNLPEGTPDWLKFAAPLVAGGLVGGKTESIVGRRLPASFAKAGAAAKSIETPDANYYIGRKKPAIFESPYALMEASAGKTKLEQTLDVFRVILGKDPINNPVFGPIIKQVGKGGQAARDMKQVVFQEVLADKRALGIKKFIDPATGASADGWIVDGKMVPVGSTFERLDLISKASPAQLAFIKRWGDEFDRHQNQYANVRGKVGKDADGNDVWVDDLVSSAKYVDPGARYAPRGRPIEDGTEDIISSQGKPKNLNAKPGQEKERGWASIEEGMANGQSYPPLEEAFADYVEAHGNAITGRHALNQLMRATDENGVPYVRDLNRAYPAPPDPITGQIARDASGKPVTIMYRAPLERGEGLIKGQNNLATSDKIANQINNALDPDGNMAAASKLAEVFSKPLRALHVAFDMGDFIARIGPTASILHPKIFAHTTAKGVTAIANDAIVGTEYKHINLENMTNGLRGMTVQDMGSRAGLRFQNTDFAGGPLKNLPVVKHLGSFYGNALDMMRARMFQTEMLNKLNSGVDVFDDKIMKQIAAGINLTTGASSGAPIRNASILIQFPNWLQSQIELVAKTASLGTLDGDYARKSLIGMVSLGTFVAVTGNAIQGNVKETIDGDNWIPTLHVGEHNINVFGPYASLARGVYGALTGNPEALIRGRGSPLVTVGWDLFTGETFMGKKADFKDNNYWYKQMMPYSGSSIYEGFKEGRPTSGFLQAVGLNDRVDTPRQKLREEAEAMFGKDYADFTGKERAQLKSAKPELYAAIDADVREHAEAGDKTAMGIVETQKVTETLLAKQESHYSLLQQGLYSPRQFREALNASVRNAAIEKQRIRKDFGLDDSSKYKKPSAVQTALDEYYNLYDSADLGTLNGTAPVGQISWEEFSRQEQALLASFTPEQRKAIEDRVTLKSPSVDWYYANREIINQSEYFQTTDVAFEQLKSSVQRRVPGATSLADLYQARNIAAREGNKGAYAYTSALINSINQIAIGKKKLMRAKDPALMAALVENGYVDAPKNLAYRPR